MQVLLTITKSTRIEPEILNIPMKVVGIVEFDTGTRAFYTKEHGSFSTSQELHTSEWYLTTIF